MTLLLIRHGESTLGAQGRYAGRLDPPLTPKGRRQALRLRAEVRRLRPARIYASPLRRCQETAEILGLKPRLTRALREMSFGAWEGLTYEQVLRRYGVRYRVWLSDPHKSTPPRGESVRHLARRVRAFVRRLPKTRRPIALVTHGGVIRALTGDWSARIRPGSLTVWRRP